MVAYLRKMVIDSFVVEAGFVWTVRDGFHAAPCQRYRLKVLTAEHGSLQSQFVDQNVHMAKFEQFRAEKTNAGNAGGIGRTD